MAERLLDDCEQVSSSRGDEPFDTMRTRIRPHRKSPSVRTPEHRAREVATRKGLAAWGQVGLPFGLEPRAVFEDVELRDVPTGRL